MKIQVSPEELKPRSLYIATPMFGGQCFGLYQTGVLSTVAMMLRYGLTVDHFALYNESDIHRARNYCVHRFRQTDFTHFMFIDADIAFRPDDVFSLLHLADPNSDKDVVCGLYPKKHIRWDKIGAAARRGVPDDELAACGSDLAFNPIGLPGSFDLYEPLEVAETATGFMMIQRRVFDKFAQAYPERVYYSDGREAGGHGEGNILACFRGHIEEGGRHRYLTEDFNFCRLIRAIGMKVWVAPWLQLDHLGFYKFIGNPQALSVSAAE